jgi:hypothetical protein
MTNINKLKDEIKEQDNQRLRDLYMEYAKTEEDPNVRLGAFRFLKFQLEHE